jgi:SsrA-binding protein
MAKQVDAKGTKLVADNRNAFREYEILERLEAGIVLQGTEVKSLRTGKVNLKEAYGRVVGGEIFLAGMHVSPYSHGTYSNHDPLRERKLLLHKLEIRKLLVKIHERGLTLVPLSLYFRGGKAKVSLGLGRGKKQHDKRADIKDREVQREMAAALRGRG